MFLEFRHLISRVREDRVYPLYALRVSSTSSGYPGFLVSSSNGFGEFQTAQKREEICIFGAPTRRSSCYRLRFLARLIARRFELRSWGCDLQARRPEAELRRGEGGRKDAQFARGEVMGNLFVDG